MPKKVGKWHLRKTKNTFNCTVTTITYSKHKNSLLQIQSTLQLAKVTIGVSFHAYVNDTQLYVHFHRDKMASSSNQLERCVLPWHLPLDEIFCQQTEAQRGQQYKTELLFASSGHCCAALKGRYPVLKVGADTAVASGHVPLLGLGVDISLDLSVDNHVSHVCNGMLLQTFSPLAYPAVAGHAHLYCG